MTKDFHLGELVDRFATSQNWTKKDLETVLGVSTSNMYKKLKMKDWDTELLRKVASAANVELWELIQFGQEGGDERGMKEPMIAYGSGTPREKILSERVNGLERENQALKEHIKTLKALISKYEDA